MTWLVTGREWLSRGYLFEEKHEGKLFDIFWNWIPSNSIMALEDKMKKWGRLLCETEKKFMNFLIPCHSISVHLFQIGCL